MKIYHSGLAEMAVFSWKHKHMNGENGVDKAGTAVIDFSSSIPITPIKSIKIIEAIECNHLSCVFQRRTRTGLVIILYMTTLML